MHFHDRLRASLCLGVFLLCFRVASQPNLHSTQPPAGPDAPTAQPDGPTPFLAESMSHAPFATSSGPHHIAHLIATASTSLQLPPPPTLPLPQQPPLLPSPPPHPPGSGAQTTATFSVRVSGSLAEFDSTEYRARLSSFLGVPASSFFVELSISGEKMDMRSRICVAHH